MFFLGLRNAVYCTASDISRILGQEQIMIRAAYLSVLVWLLSGLAMAAEEPTRREWTVEGQAREGLVYVPTAAKSTPSPMVFAFHGHGGTMRGAVNTFAMHKHWPEAIIVYLQGLNTPGRLTDPEGKKPGWQHSAGEQGDRDLKFFDAVLASLKADYRVDDKRIYSTGHSNGGGFTYLLWAARGDVFAAMAPSSAAATRQQKDLKPKPVLHIAGENDPLVLFSWQKQTMDELRKLNGCEETGTNWGKHCTLYSSKQGTPVITCIHPGTHKYLEDAPSLTVKFFKEYTK